MYEDLDRVAQLKFNKKVDLIYKQAREKMKEMRNEYAAITGSSGVRSGQHEASIGRVQIDAAEQSLRALYQIWIDLIKRQKGHISHPDIAFIAGKLESDALTRVRHLRESFSQQLMGAVTNLLIQEAEMRRNAVVADLRGELEIMVSEQELFPMKKAQDPEARPEATATRTELKTSPARVSKSLSDAPSALLSYSWDSPEHQQWVNDLAKRLQELNGVAIVFDQWYLNPGDDRLHFMERGVADSDFVIVVCTPTYADRANKRQRGVGYESMVITAQLAKNTLTNKFIPVLRSGTWDSSLPTYLESKMGVDLSSEPYSESEYDVTGDFCTRWNERKSTWRKSWSCRSRGTNQSRS